MFFFAEQALPVEMEKPFESRARSITFPGMFLKAACTTYGENSSGFSRRLGGTIVQPGRAESFSTNVTEKNYLSVILARCNQANELYKSEYSIAKWVSESMDAIASQKNVQTLKQATTWNKVGSKLQGGFTLFSR